MIKKIHRVLLVDDNEIDNIISHVIISKMEIANEIIKLNNGKEALDYLTKNCNNGLEVQNLIFLDINMPVMDGFKFLKAFNSMEKKEKFKIVMLSSSRDGNDKNNCLKLEVSDFLEKPISKEAIASIISRI